MAPDDSDGDSVDSTIEIGDNVTFGDGSLNLNFRVGVFQYDFFDGRGYAVTTTQQAMIVYDLISVTINSIHGYNRFAGDEYDIPNLPTILYAKFESEIKYVAYLHLIDTLPPDLFKRLLVAIECKDHLLLHRPLRRLIPDNIYHQEFHIPNIVLPHAEMITTFEDYRAYQEYCILLGECPTGLLQLLLRPLNFECNILRL